MRLIISALNILNFFLISQAISFNTNYSCSLPIPNISDNFAVYGCNKFGNLTKDAFKKTYLGLKENIGWDFKIHTEKYKESTPSHIDWTKLGAVTPVKNQLECGSCWAFSATGDMEGTAFIKFGVSRNLSEQQLVDCVSQDFQCQGGLPSDAFEYTIQNGIQSESEYKYTGTSDKCKFKKDIEVFKIDSWIRLPSNESLIESYVAKNGPVSIGINADLFQFYQKGIITNTSLCDPNVLDHGVLIVGYGTSENVKYWKIKNSWGSDWGENGYIRIIRGKGACGLNKMVTHSIANPDNQPFY